MTGALTGAIQALTTVPIDCVDVSITIPDENGTGADNSLDSAERKAKTGIGHGIATIMTDGSR